MTRIRGTGLYSSDQSIGCAIGQLNIRARLDECSWCSAFQAFSKNADTRTLCQSKHCADHNSGPQTALLLCILSIHLPTTNSPSAQPPPPSSQATPSTASIQHLIAHSVPNPEKTNMLVAPTAVSYSTNVTPLTSLLKADEERLAHAFTYPIGACIAQDEARGPRL